MTALARALVVTELQGRDLLRRRAVMALFVLLPAAFYYSVPSTEAYGLVAGSMGVSWAVAAAGLFGVLGWRRAETRLALAGGGVVQALAGRLVLLNGLALVLVAGFAPQIIVRSRDLIDDPALFVSGLGLMALVSVPIGLAMGALVPRELEGTLVLIGVVGIGTSVPPDTGVAQSLPLWGPLEVMQVAAGLSDGPASRGVWHAVGSVAVLLAFASWSLHRRARIAPPTPIAAAPTPCWTDPCWTDPCWTDPCWTDPCWTDPCWTERITMSVTTERPDPAPVDAPPSGDAFVAKGLLAVTLILAAYQVIARGIIPALAVFAVLFAVAAVLVWRRRARWTLITSGVLALLYLAGSVQFFVANLAHPESPVSFLAEAFLLVALGTVLGGVVGTLRGAGRGALRRIASVALALGGVAVVVSAVAALSVDTASRQADDVAIEIVHSGFPEDVEVAADGAVLWVANEDPFHHTFVIDGADVREVLPSSSAVRIPVELDPGTYRFWCDVPGHESMEGRLHVR